MALKGWTPSSAPYCWSRLIASVGGLAQWTERSFIKLISRRRTFTDCHVLYTISCPYLWRINCPAIGSISCLRATEWQKRILSCDAYLHLWSHLGTITCPLVHPENSEGQITKNAALFWTCGIRCASKRTTYGKKRVHEARLFYPNSNGGSSYLG